MTFKKGNSGNWTHQYLNHTYSKYVVKNSFEFYFISTITIVLVCINYKVKISKLNWVLN